MRPKPPRLAPFTLAAATLVALAPLLIDVENTEVVPSVTEPGAMLMVSTKSVHLGPRPRFRHAPVL